MPDSVAFPDATFLVVFKPGYYAGDEESGDVVTPIEDSHGGHGFSPEFAEMRSSGKTTGFCRFWRPPSQSRRPSRALTTASRWA
jgi:hypothetical protein